MLKESVDFEKVGDPSMGVIPYTGEYEVYHEAPAIKAKLMSSGRILTRSVPNILFVPVACRLIIVS